MGSVFGSCRKKSILVLWISAVFIISLGALAAPQKNSSPLGNDFFIADTLKNAEKMPDYDRYQIHLIPKATERFITDDVRYEVDQKSLTWIPFRDKNVNEIIDILANRGAAFLWGEEGVGKEAIVERLAQMIVTGQIPNRKVFTPLVKAEVIKTTPSDINLLKSDAAPSIMIYLNLVSNAQKVLKKNFIVYIENVGQFDVQSLSLLAEYIKDPLHPVSVILSAPPSSLNPITKKVPSLLNVTTQLGVEDLQPAQVKELFDHRWAGYLEAKYMVKVKDPAIQLAIQFAKKLYPQKSLLNGAIQVLSDAAVLLNHEQSEKTGDLDLSDKGVMAYIQKKLGLEINPLDPRALAKYETQLRKYLSSKVLGQEGMVNSLVDMWMDLQEPTSKRGVRVITFMGPTSVGKSLLAREFSQRVFKHDKARLEIACSEYTTKGSLDALLGMPTDIWVQIRPPGF